MILQILTFGTCSLLQCLKFMGIAPPKWELALLVWPVEFVSGSVEVVPRGAPALPTLLSVISIPVGASASVGRDGTNLVPIDGEAT